MATTLEGALIAFLAANSTVAAIIGATPIVPASDPTPWPRPRLYYQTINAGRQYCNDGPLTLTQSLIYLYASADDMQAARLLAIASRKAIEPSPGQMGNIKVASVRSAGPIDEVSEAIPGGATSQQRVRLELTIDWQNTI